MPAGLEIYDEAGNLIVSITDRITRLLGSVNTGTSAGSVNVASFTSGVPFFFVQDYYVPSPGGDDNTGAPGVSISGTVISWTFSELSIGRTPRAVNIHYGVY